jgi:hypothetical protein
MANADEFPWLKGFGDDRLELATASPGIDSDPGRNATLHTREYLAGCYAEENVGNSRILSSAGHSS